jgi:DNA-binding NarL/FixJ family response regulator
VVDGEWVIDPTIVSRLIQRRRVDSPLSRITGRENEILALMAEGRSNAGIASQLSLSERTVEAVSAQLFRKLGLEPSKPQQRVLAVLNTATSLGRPIHMLDEAIERLQGQR